MEYKISTFLSYVKCSETMLRVYTSPIKPIAEQQNEKVYTIDTYNGWYIVSCEDNNRNKIDMFLDEHEIDKVIGYFSLVILGTYKTKDERYLYIEL